MKKTICTLILAGAADWITEKEQAHLVDGALVIVCEQALRFLEEEVRLVSYADSGMSIWKRTRSETE